MHFYGQELRSIKVHVCFQQQTEILHQAGKFSREMKCLISSVTSWYCVCVYDDLKQGNRFTQIYIKIHVLNFIFKYTINKGF